MDEPDELPPLPDWVYYAIIVGFVALAVIGAVYFILIFLAQGGAFPRPPDGLWLHIVSFIYLP